MASLRSSSAHLYYFFGIIVCKILSFSGTDSSGLKFNDCRKRSGERRTMTRAGLHDAVIHATRQSSDIVVMGATSWN